VTTVKKKNTRIEVYIKLDFSENSHTDITKQCIKYRNVFLHVCESVSVTFQPAVNTRGEVLCSNWSRCKKKLPHPHFIRTIHTR